MTKITTAIMVICSLLLLSMPATGTESEPVAAEGTIFTFWPLIDYRESPQEGFSNLGLLGPFIKIQKKGDEQIVAVRPLFHRSSNEQQGRTVSSYLYPLASSETTSDVSRFQFLKLIQKNSYHKEDKEAEEKDSMFFPFYISGVSKKYGPYTSVFPIYGDIYERFWKDEYHYFLFPLYGRTVKKGTTSSNYLYPFFNRVEGEKESGFHFWPLYGQAAKEGVYSSKFVLWPFYMKSSKGIDTENPTEKLFLFPLYTSTDSPDKTERGYLWPFFGYSEDRKLKETEHDYLWPLWRTVRGENRQLDSYLPFYFKEERKESSRTWYLWPIYRNDTMSTDTFSRDRDRILYFLYTDSLERWTKDGTERKRSAFWPFYVYKRDMRGVKTFTFPAPVEPILDREEIEENWAPLWRIYNQKWGDSGESALSILWNLYWHEAKKDALAYELFPLVSYRGGVEMTDASFIKGFIRYRNLAGEKSLNLFWLPFGFTWGEKVPLPNDARHAMSGGGL